jgi:ribulose-5-phosphate 4-epimerase/fuculose-1-phosphate aldolase
LLTVGGSAGQAFLRMFCLERACEIQLRAQAGGLLVLPSPEVAERAARQLAGEATAGDDLTDADGADLAWQALLRLVSRIAPDYRD